MIYLNSRLRSVRDGAVRECPRSPAFIRIAVTFRSIRPIDDKLDHMLSPSMCAATR